MNKNLLDVVQGTPSPLFSGFRIEIKGNREVVLEGCGGVQEYSEETVRVKAGKMSIRFSGRNLKIQCLTADSLVLEGYLTGMEFIT